ncbi:TetR/AcrR family transcriptional regulator [Streptomyces sp. MspMP-M5]|uniref:TetR/AcrR family transcriptional regulator n=1 Tax=unclassified Streptomyces TaxID=2593676 RepID=UPI000382C4A3|nr:TetR/AcrR family transcriptional regulator [Streptomyces sp. MspMP-M5]MYT29238.1 TetR family transcriptional regulator [Streptomyces sp. SID8354]
MIQPRHGKSTPLSREVIVDTAHQLVESQGFEGLSMRRIAADLGCTPMALYRHIRDRDELVTLLLDRSVAAAPEPVLPDDPRQCLITLIDWQYHGLSAHPWAIPIVQAGDLMPPSILGTMEKIYAALTQCGTTPEQAAVVYRIVWNFVIGSLTHRVHRDRRATAPPAQVTIPAEADPQTYPTIAALSSYWRSASRGNSFREDLELLLTALLDAVTSSPPTETP